MKVYSPSQTKTFLECPRLRQYDQLGFHSRIPTKKDVGAVVGTGMHVALDCLAETDSLDWALKALEWYCGGTQLPAGFQWEDYQPNMLKLVRMFHEQNPLHPYISIQGAIRYHSLGNCELDGIVRGVSGDLTFVDYKSKLTVYGHNADQRRNTWSGWWAEYQHHDWQFLHYTWVMMKEFGVRIDQYGVVILALSPKPEIQVQWIPVDWTMMESWIPSAEHYWKEMQQQEWLYQNDPQYRAPIGVRHYNPQFKSSCLYLDACTTYKNDYTLMEIAYQRKER